MRIAVDVTHEGGFEPLPAENYAVKVVEAQEKTSPGGNKYIRIVMECVDEKFVGRKLFHNLSLLPQSLWNLKTFLDCCSVEYDESGFDTEDILGAELEVTVGQEEYQGAVKNKVTGYLPLK